MTIYVRDGNNQKVKDATVTAQFTQRDQYNNEIQKGLYQGQTNKSGKVKFNIYTNDLIPNVPCVIYINARYSDIVTGSTVLEIYPTGKSKIPLLIHIVSDVTLIRRGAIINLTAVGDNLVANNFINHTIWERTCIGDTSNYNKFADVSSASTTWESRVAPPRTTSVQFKVTAYDNLGRIAVAYLTLPYSD